MGKGGESPKAVSNRYPYLFSSCGRAQIFLSYIQMRQHIILRKKGRMGSVVLRWIRIGIPICFLAVVELNYYLHQLMYTIFSVIIGGRVAFFDFYNGIMNLLE